MRTLSLVTNSADADASLMPCFSDTEAEEFVTQRLHNRYAMGVKAAATCTLALVFVGTACVAAVISPKPSPTQASGRTALAKGSLFLAEEASGDRQCWKIAGVKVAESGTPKNGWASCSAKWSVDCSKSGCCTDPGMKCYKKNKGWSACLAKCAKKDTNNDTWACDVVDPPIPHTAEQCEKSCIEDSTCATAIFNSDGGGACTLSKERLTNVVWASDSINSSFCGTADEKDKIEGLIKEVRSGLPFVQPALPMQNCSWGGEDCSENKCCNDVKCDAHFSNCYGYSCYKKTKYFSGCRIDAPPDGWEGTWLGGGRVHRQLGPAGSQVALHGTSLYCFAVVSWDAPPPKPFWASEAQLANNIKSHGISLMQCDGHDFYDGIQTPKAAWGSFSNIDAFQLIWKKVQEKRVFEKFDWTVKVDADAVFFPNRLKQHLDKLRVPLGSKVYLENTDFRFKFMGALEVVSKEALLHFLKESHTCIRGKHEGGEDFFMKGCMDAIGIDHMSDYDLLHDKYASQDGPCTDGWAVAYHFHKKVISWNWCYNEAVCGNRGKTCPEGIPVEYVMPWAPNPGA